jgi:hypothetical protein
LGQLAQGDEKKAAIAALIQSRTTVSNHWLAETLQLGTQSSQSIGSICQNRLGLSETEARDHLVS